MIYRGFGRKLHHHVPEWVRDGAIFHIRIANEHSDGTPLLTSPAVAGSLLDSARLYEEQQQWQVTIFLIMPTHVHALLSFGRHKSMAQVLSDWKRFHARHNRLIWQENFFDHRLRNDERGEQLAAKVRYIRQNPVVAGLCARATDWPWVYPAQPNN